GSAAGRPTEQGCRREEQPRLARSGKHCSPILTPLTAGCVLPAPAPPPPRQVPPGEVQMRFEKLSEVKQDLSRAHRPLARPAIAGDARDQLEADWNAVSADGYVI